MLKRVILIDVKLLQRLQTMKQSERTKRIIPCLDIKDGRVVKGVNFVGLKDAGDPLEIAARYSDEGADELAFLDISATNENRDTIVELVERVVAQIDIPLTVGGGIKTIENIDRILSAGAAKVSINSAAIANPNIINEGAKKYGSNSIMVAIDVKKIDGVYRVLTHGGERDSGIDALEWAKEVESRGAGEILLTSMDADGTKAGFDLDITSQIAKAVSIPVIASGGAGNMEHMRDALVAGADAALAASIFHFRDIEIKPLKEYLQSQGISVKI